MINDKPSTNAISCYFLDDTTEIIQPHDSDDQSGGVGQTKSVHRKLAEGDVLKPTALQVA